MNILKKSFFLLLLVAPVALFPAFLSDGVIYNNVAYVNGGVYHIGVPLGMDVPLGSVRVITHPFALVGGVRLRVRVENTGQEGSLVLQQNGNRIIFNPSSEVSSIEPVQV